VFDRLKQKHQIDFGEAESYEEITKYNGHYLNISFPYSNAGYLQLFKGENQQCLWRDSRTSSSISAGCRHGFGLTTPGPSSKVLRGGERVLTEAFARFKNHYGFAVAFCNANSGHVSMAI
jgi:hypothetical protein